MNRCAGWLETPVGRHWVVASPAGVVAIHRGEAAPDGVRIDLEAMATPLAALAAYFAGRQREIPIALDLGEATAFDIDVWTAARAIPYGSTVSYAELAIMAGRPGAARAVGGSMARCPVAPVVPCHRVIHSDGSVGGWGSDPWVKRWLLDLEAQAVG